jgi:predicted polyphosphate/ATP-dependent NAD kinase
VLLLLPTPLLQHLPVLGLRAGVLRAHAAAHPAAAGRLHVLLLLLPTPLQHLPVLGLRAGVLHALAAVRPAAAAAEPAVGALLRLQLPLLRGLVLVAAAWLRAAARQ